MAQTKTAVILRGKGRMLGLSLDIWNYVLLGSLVVGVVATYAVIRLQGLESEEAKTALDEYKLAVAGDIAEANARQAEAELALAHLQKRVAPRRILAADFLKSLEGGLKPSLPIEILYSRDDADSQQLASQLYTLLSLQAKWPVDFERPLPPATIDSYLPSTLLAGGNTSGVTIVENPGDQDRTPGGALKVALIKSLGSIAWARKSELPVGKVRIVIAPRL
jgi:hypothetical protein